MNEMVKDTDVTYRYNTDFMYITTYIPGLFCAVGNGRRKQKPLKVAALAFAYPLSPQTCEPEPGQETGNCGIDIKVFLVDYFNEAIKVCELYELLSISNGNSSFIWLLSVIVIGYVVCDSFADIPADVYEA